MRPDNKIKKALVCSLASHAISNERTIRSVRSILNQKECYFDFDIKVVTNSLKDEYHGEVVDAFKKVDLFDHPKIEIVKTESNGTNGRGHNSLVELFGKNEKYSHLMYLDSDDFYYPTAFKAIAILAEKEPFDVLNCIGVIGVEDPKSPRGYVDGGQGCDELNMFPNMERDRVQLKENLWLWSSAHKRYKIFPWIYWNGIQCPGGERTVCVSRAAAEQDIGWIEGRTADGPLECDDYGHMINCLYNHVKGKIRFVNTDCNDIYIYDQTNLTSIRQDRTAEDSHLHKADKFDPELGWPFDKEGIVKKYIQDEKYHCLDKLTRENFPYVTIDSLMTIQDKVNYVLENYINEEV
jgi:hypothetical protein